MDHYELLDLFVIEICSSNIRTFSISAHANWGPRLRMLKLDGVAYVPHRLGQTFLGAHVCKVTLKQLPQHFISHAQILLYI